MTSGIAINRIKQALEKQDSEFNANLNLFDIEDALDKAQNDWFRRQIHGGNQYREGSEESLMRVDDFQFLIMERSLNVKKSSLYSESDTIPSNYRYYNRLNVFATKGDCTNTIIPSLLIENHNVNDYLVNYNFSPSFDFEQCFHVILNNKIRIYHNGDFDVNKIILSYYRDPSKLLTDKNNWDYPWEWKDDVAEVIIDEAIKILAGQIEHTTAFQLSNQRVESNN